MKSKSCLKKLIQIEPQIGLWRTTLCQRQQKPLKPPQEIQLKSADTAVNGKYTIKKSVAEYNPTIPQVLLNANLCSATEDFYRDGPNEFCYSSIPTLDSNEDPFENMFHDF